MDARVGWVCAEKEPMVFAPASNQQMNFIAFRLMDFFDSAAAESCMKIFSDAFCYNTVKGH